MTPAGTWQLTIKTPVGSLPVELVVTDDRGSLVARAHGQGQDIPITDMVLVQHPDGSHLTWTQSVTRPLRLTLQFDVLISDDTLEGAARAGRLPASHVTGTRSLETA